MYMLETFASKYTYVSIIKGRKCDGSIPNCCTESDQCDFGDGHCDSDDQCLGTLICGTKNCVGNKFDPNKGCCTEPNMDI